MVGITTSRETKYSSSAESDITHLNLQLMAVLKARFDFDQI